MKYPKFSLSLALFLGLALVMSAGAALAQDKSVKIGYQLMLNPEKLLIANHSLEKATGYHIKWVRFTAGGEAARGLAAGAVDMTVIGSVGITTAVSNHVPAKLFWIQEGIAKNERLVARKDIKNPKDLAGKKLGVSLGSTSQLDLYYALKEWGVKAHVIYMDLPSIVSAWNRGDIDGAYVWPPALFKMLKDGHTLTTSAVVCQKLQICTYDGLMVNTKWANAHPDFMVKFLHALNNVNKQYLNNKDAWTVDSKQVKAISKISGAGPDVVVKALHNYSFPTMKEQISDRWLGGGAIHSLAITAQWLNKLGTLSQPLKDYSPTVTTKWVKMALKQQ
jgi:taurine transport system substrate-binding protein